MVMLREREEQEEEEGVVKNKEGGRFARKDEEDLERIMNEATAKNTKKSYKTLR